MVPLNERHSRLRPFLDVASGCYPRFVFGGKLKADILPVFHFHEESPDTLEPCLRFLQENRYQTLAVDECLAFISGELALPPRSVFLCFDDAWTSVWTVVAPLLRKYSLCAVTFAIPGRVAPATDLRPTIEEDPEMSDFGDDSEQPFANWAELRALDREGVLEVESHTNSHAMIPVHPDVEGVWTPAEISSTPLLSRPTVRGKTSLAVRPICSGDPLQPKFPMRSRISDAQAILPDPDWLIAFSELAKGRVDPNIPMGESNWKTLIRSLPPTEYTIETESERRESILREIRGCRDRLVSELGRPQRLFCAPWTIAGKIAVNEIREAGYKAAFVDRMWGRRYLCAGSYPYHLMRLKQQWLWKLPTL